MGHGLARVLIGAWGNVPRGLFDGASNAGIGAAPAEVAGHISIDVAVTRRRVFSQESGGRHDLSGLTISALWNRVVYPGLLYGVEVGVRCRASEAFDGGDVLSSNICWSGLTAPHRFSIHMNGAGAASADATSELCSYKTKFVAQDPEQGAVCNGVVYLPGTAINCDIHLVFPFVCLKEDLGLCHSTA